MTDVSQISFSLSGDVDARIVDDEVDVSVDDDDDGDVGINDDVIDTGTDSGTSKLIWHKRLDVDDDVTVGITLSILSLSLSMLAISDLAICGVFCDPYLSLALMCIFWSFHLAYRLFSFHRFPIWPSLPSCSLNLMFTSSWSLPVCLPEVVRDLLSVCSTVSSWGP